MRTGTGASLWLVSEARGNHCVEPMMEFSLQKTEQRSIFVIMFELHSPCTSKYVS